MIDWVAYGSTNLLKRPCLGLLPYQHAVVGYPFQDEEAFEFGKPHDRRCVSSLPPSQPVCVLIELQTYFVLTTSFPSMSRLSVKLPKSYLLLKHSCSCQLSLLFLPHCKVIAIWGDLPRPFSFVYLVSGVICWCCLLTCLTCTDSYFKLYNIY